MSPGGRETGRRRNILVASGGTFVGGMAGAALPFVVTAVLGVSGHTDAYFFAVGSTLFVTSLFAVVMEGIIVPFVFENRTRGRVALVSFLLQSVATSASGAALVAMGALAVVATVLPATAFSPAERRLTIQLLLLLLPLAPLMATTSVLAGAHFAFDRFAVPTATLAFRALGGMLSVLVLHDHLGIAAVPVGLVAGEMARVGLLATGVRNCLGSFDEGSGEPTSQRALLRSATPQLVSLVLVGLNPLIDKVVAAGLESGSVTAIELAEKLFWAPMVLLSSGIGIVSATAWARPTPTTTEKTSLKEDFWRTQRLVFLVSAGCVAAGVGVFLLVGTQLSGLLGFQDTILVPLFVLYLVGLPAALFSNLGARLFVAQRFTRILPMIAFLNVTANLVLDLVGARWFGVHGIAAASTSWRILSACVYALLAHRLLTYPRKGRIGPRVDLQVAPETPDDNQSDPYSRSTEATMLSQRS